MVRNITNRVNVLWRHVSKCTFLKRRSRLAPADKNNKSRRPFANQTITEEQSGGCIFTPKKFGGWDKCAEGQQQGRRKKVSQIRAWRPGGKVARVLGAAYSLSNSPIRRSSTLLSCSTSWGG